MSLKKLTFCLLALCLVLPAQAQPNLPIPSPPSFQSSSFILLDHNSGQILAEKASDERVDPASITKLMTAYIIFSELRRGNIQLSDETVVSKKAWKAEGSRMFIEVNKRVNIEDLLRGMIVQSGNDASIALAEHVAGDEATFAAWMNQHAERLGMVNTNYTNATGLTHAEHYSSARDIAILSRALISEFPEWYSLYSEKDFTYNGITQSNRNKLLWRDDSADGIKTGYTKAAGYCLASSAERDGMRLISVVLGTPNGNARIRASEALLNYGFRFFETQKLAAQGETLAQGKIWKGSEAQLALGSLQDVFVTIPRGRNNALNLNPIIDPKLIAPITNGQHVGQIQVELNGKTIKQAPLVALDEMPLGSLWQRLRDEIWLFVKR